MTGTPEVNCWFCLWNFDGIFVFVKFYEQSIYKKASKELSDMYSILTKVSTVFTLFAFLIVFSHVSLGQTKMTGVLTLAETSPSVNDAYVTVNGERAESGRTIVSPAEIVTPSNINAKVTVTNLGSVTISPNSTLNLRFDSSSISGVLVTGEFIVYSNPNIAVDLATPDGKISIPASSKLNSFEVKIVNGKSTVYSILGSTDFNGNKIAAGDYFPRPPKENEVQKKSSGGGSNGMLIGILLAAVGGGVLLAVVSSSGGNETVSPVR